VAHVDTIMAPELYNRAKRWLVKEYVSAKDVIQLDDPQNGEIIGKGFFKETWQVTFYAFQPIDVYHTVTIQVKDGRFRYTINGFRVKYYVSPTQYTSSSNVDMALEDWPATTGENAQRIAKQ